MGLKLIESLVHNSEGYNPFLIRDGWQVAQLNYIPSLDPGAITRMEMHRQTDEVFILVQGEAVLIAGELTKKGFVFQCIHLEMGRVYNIPVNVWHNIAMNKDARLIIVERSNTHLDDVIYHSLSGTEMQVLKDEIGCALHP